MAIHDSDWCQAADILATAFKTNLGEPVDPELLQTVRGTIKGNKTVSIARLRQRTRSNQYLGLLTFVRYARAIEQLNEGEYDIITEESLELADTCVNSINQGWQFRTVPAEHDMLPQHPSIRRDIVSTLYELEHLDTAYRLRNEVRIKNNACALLVDMASINIDGAMELATTLIASGDKFFKAGSKLPSVVCHQMFGMHKKIISNGSEISDLYWKNLNRMIDLTPGLLLLPIRVAWAKSLHGDTTKIQREPS